MNRLHTGWLPKPSVMLLPLWLMSGCGEPLFENAGSLHSLVEDRQACAVEIDQSSAASAYRENPTAHPEYVSQVFHDMNRCIEQKGWRQVKSPQEQEEIRDAIAAEAAHAMPPLSLSETKTIESFARAVEDKLVRSH